MKRAQMVYCYVAVFTCISMKTNSELKCYTGNYYQFVNTELSDITYAFVLKLPVYF